MNAPAPAPAPTAEAPAAADQAAPAAEALRALTPKRAERVIEGHATEEQAAGQAVQASPSIMSTPAAAPSPPPPTDTARDPHDTPAQELDKIRRLFATDRRDEARQRLADFHRERPDYPLPDDLRAQLLTP